MNGRLRWAVVTAVLATVPMAAPSHAQMACDGVLRLPGGADHHVEMSVSVDPTDHRKQVVAVIRTDLPGGGDNNIFAYTTFDGGRTWSGTAVPRPAGVPANAHPNSDPVVTHDELGNVYVAYNLGRSAIGYRTIAVARSLDSGMTFDRAEVVGEIPGNVLLDKMWIEAVTDSTSPYAGNIYIVWVDTAQHDLYFNRSEDRGATWPNEYNITPNSGQNLFFGSVAVGPDGDVYASWFERDTGEIMTQSLGENGDFPGSMVSVRDVAFTSSLPTISPSPSRAMHSAPTIDVDRSPGPHRGRLWVAFCDYSETGDPEDLSVWVSWSDDEGANWDSVDLGSTGSAQFLPALSVDNADGSVGLLYYSNEEGSTPAHTHVYYRQFSDGDPANPLHWTKRRMSISESPPGMNPEDDYREYVGLHEQGNVGYASWTTREDGPGQALYAQTRGRLTQIHSGANDEPDDHFGDTMATGDFDGDGFDDLAVGAPNEDNTVTEEGRVIVQYGSADGLFPSRAERLGEGLAGSVAEQGDHFGAALAAGDFDGDGFDDLAVGVPDEDGAATDDGQVIVFFGSQNGLNPVNAQFLTQANGNQTREAGDRFGATLAVGDFDGDQFDDLAVASPTEDIAADGDGVVTVFYGTPSGLTTGSGTDALTEATAGGAPENGDHFGLTLAAGDLDGDQRDDLVVGLPDEDDVATDDGNVIVFYGGSSGLLPADTERISQVDAGRPSEPGDRFGSALAVGDFDGSGHDDLAVGVPDEFQNFDADGVVIAFFGSAQGLLQPDTAMTELLTQTAGGETMETGDRFGATLTVDDFDRDGFGDLVVGVPFEDVTVEDDGLAIAFYGSAAGLRSQPPEQLLPETAGNGAELDDRFGATLTSGDFNGDCVPDLAIAAPREDIFSTPDAGAVYFLPGTRGRLLDGPAARYIGDANCNGCVDYDDHLRILGETGTPGSCGSDLNADGTVDSVDLAIVLGGCGEGTCSADCVDADCDGLGAAGALDCPLGTALDCNDGDVGVWDLPGTVPSLRMSLNPGSLVTTIDWDPPADTGGAPDSLSYDLLLSAIAMNFTTGATCFVSGTSATAVSSDEVPPPGTVEYFVVRAGNSCGDGGLGTDSFGTVRAGRVCP
jgi:hypothetical protein